MTKYNLKEALQAGIELFRLKGYHHTGTEELLNKSGLPRSSFYHHFKNKEGYAVEAIKVYGDQIEEFYRSFLLNKHKKDLIRRYFELLNCLFGQAKKNQFRSQCLVQKMSNECAGESDKISKALQSVIEKMLRVFIQYVEEGQAKGTFKKELSAHSIASLLHGQLYGTFTLNRPAKNADKMLEDCKAILNIMLK